ncbi:MAG: choice-of-anchor R domain-containing protein [Terriglobales bacterium]
MKKTLLFVCLMALCSMNLLAQAKHARTMHTTEKSAIHVPPEAPDTSLTVIYSNLNSNQSTLYNDSNGWTLSGPNSEIGITQFIGLPFTPAANSHVSEVQVAVQYAGAGANQINLSIYTDDGGVPGTLISKVKTVKNLSTFGTCCTLTVAKFTPVEVTAGTQYWVVADTPLTGKGDDLYGVWDYVYLNAPQAFSQGSGWIGFDASETEAAGEVLGTTP